MMCGPVRPLCLLLWILRAAQGVEDVIQTQQTVSAALGKNATLGCQLLETKVVSQVTWQKVLENKHRNIAAYSEKFGPSVYPEYKDKIQFAEAGLQKSSIVIRNVTEQDAGCYLCLFTVQWRLCILHHITEASDGFLLLQQWQPGLFYCPAWNSFADLSPFTTFSTSVSFVEYHICVATLDIKEDLTKAAEEELYFDH